MKKDTEEAKMNTDTYKCTIDLQKALPFPVLTVSDMLIIRGTFIDTIWVYLTSKKIQVTSILGTRQSMAERGSQEISSCVIEHLQIHARNKKRLQFTVTHALVKTGT